MSELNIKRILLIRLSALGDCLAAVPVFYTLRERFPHVHLAWAIQDNFAPLIRNLPGLDEVIIFPRKRWRELQSKHKQFKEFWRFARHVRHRKFDVSIDVQSNSKSAMIGWLSRARLRIGHGKPEAKEISAWLNNRLVSPPEGMEHIVHRNLNLLTPLGIKPGEPNFDLPPDPYAARAINGWMNHKKLEAGKFVLLVPFSGNIIKEWPQQEYSNVAQELAKQGKQVVFLNGPGKENETKAMVNDSRSDRVLLGPSTNLLQMVELVRQAACVVGSDTGPVQIGGALGVPTVSLFGPTDPKRSHPWGAGSVLELDADFGDVRDRVLKYV